MNTHFNLAGKAPWIITDRTGVSTDAESRHTALILFFAGQRTLAVTYFEEV